MRLSAQNCFLSRREAALIRKLARSVFGRSGRRHSATAVVAANTILNKMRRVLDGEVVPRKGSR